MAQRVTAKACANIALVKYWGKREDQRNTPATPSISLALSELTTKTTVERIGDDPRETPDHVELDGGAATGDTAARIVSYLSLWRGRGLIDGAYSVISQNTFPTGSGLASSSSGFAALAVALAAFSKQRLNSVEISRLARRGSGSAARSVAGSLAAMPSTYDPAARRLLDTSDVPLGMVVAIVETSPKKVGSTEGMTLSRETSPFYNTWVAAARKDYRDMLNAIRQSDFDTVGRLTEENCYAMHSCMLTTRPPLLYCNEVTIRLLGEVIDWRAHGLKTWATADAGPHVCFLAARSDLDAVQEAVSNVRGVFRTVVNQPGAPAEIIESE